MKHDQSLAVRRARCVATSLLHRYGIDDPSHLDLEALAIELGADIVHCTLDGALARLFRVGRRAVIRVSHANVIEGQRRFSIAHELGHLALDHKSSLAAVCDSTHQHDQHGGSSREAEANTFAAELLLPESLVRRRCEVSPVSLDVVRAIAEDFGTSVGCAAIRFAELTSERCAAIYAQDGRIQWCVRSTNFWPSIERGQRLDPWSLAADYARKGHCSSAREPVPADAWIATDELHGLEEIEEHTVAVPDVDATLTLLWIPESSIGAFHRQLPVGDDPSIWR